MKKSKNLKRILITVFLLISVLFLTSSKALANKNGFEVMEYTKEYQEWLLLSDEEKENRIEPRRFEIKSSITNTFSSNNLLKKANSVRSAVVARFTLKDLISNNLKVRNQEQTNSCWAFSSISALETNLALKDYYAKKQEVIYDFSERHMEYATSREFLNGEINTEGFNRKVGAGGSFHISNPYLTNGTGAIPEAEMKFENNENMIALSQIKDKTVSTTVKDVVKFPAYNPKVDDVTLIKQQFKQQITDYGAVDVGIFGAQITSDYYNNATGAIYCDNKVLAPINHAVTLVGWDDNYAVDNFNEAHRPQNKGAWIVRNSWGEYQEQDLRQTLTSLKNDYFTRYPSSCASNGWNSAEAIPDNFILEMLTSNGYYVDGDKIKMDIGDKGFMYISYEDVNVYRDSYGIVNAQTGKDYDSIYQYDFYGWNSGITYNGNKVYLANVFNRSSNKKEYLTQVSVSNSETYTCKVWINPNGTSKSKSDLKEVRLKAGATETFEAGYHTLEFAEPVELTGSTFVVVLEVQGGNNSSIEILTSDNVPDTPYSIVEVVPNKSFGAGEGFTNDSDWTDFTQYGNLTIKAFTSNQIEQEDTLSNIAITTPPTKTDYYVGENFDNTGMVVTANYTSGKQETITNYTITDGTNLKTGQTSVTISYAGKTANQPITVKNDVLVSIRIAVAPTKMEYLVGENFDKTGMKVMAIYESGAEKEVTNYTIINGTDLKEGQSKVTISYEGKTITQPITVKQLTVSSIKIKTPPFKTSYIVGQNFDKAGMEITAVQEDGTENIVTNYAIEDGTNLQLEQTAVTISYLGKTVQQPIKVEDKLVTKIELKVKPTKVTYIQNKEELDLTGGVILVTYNDNSTEEISTLSYLIVATGFDNSNLGEQIITLTYENKTVTYTVTIETEKTETPGGEEQPPKKGPVSSDFSNRKGYITSGKMYTYTTDIEKGYTIMNVEIKNIVCDPNNDTYEYYFYLSGNQAETSISEELWRKNSKLEKASDGTYTIMLTINSKELPNYQELAEAENLYLYLKEVVTKNGEQKTTITQSTLLEQIGELEVYVDDVKKDINDIIPEKPGQGDGTINNNRIPNAGATITIIIILVGTLIVGIVSFIRYRNIDK